MFATTPIATRVTASGVLGAVQLTAAVSFKLGHPWPVVAATACCVQKGRCKLEDLLRDRFDAHVHDAATLTALTQPCQALSQHTLWSPRQLADCALSLTLIMIPSPPCRATAAARYLIEDYL